MKILAVADAEERALGEHFDPQRWRDVDLLVSCGDLDPEYLDYLVSRLNVPCLYVRGNHDTAYRERPPGGCEDIHGRIVKVGGLRFAGLEGSAWYGGKGVEYSESSMSRRAFLLDVRTRLAGGIDILVTHAPPLLLNPDGTPEPTDRVHRGFESVRRFVEKRQPQLVLHGHIHGNHGQGKRERTIGQTRVIDCFNHRLVDVEPRR